LIFSNVNYTFSSAFLTTSSTFSSASASYLAAPSEVPPDCFSLSTDSISVLSFLTFFSSADDFLAADSSFFF